jgi:hypothetical protein
MRKAKTERRPTPNRFDRLPKSSPSPRKRAAYFVVGAVLGGILGYGLVTAGPGPAPSIFAPGARLWVLGGALAWGVLSARSPAAFWRQNRFAGGMTAISKGLLSGHVVGNRRHLFLVTIRNK